MRSTSHLHGKGACGRWGRVVQAVTADMPGIDREPLLQLIREAVERQFGLRIEREERTERVYMLTTLRNPSPQLRPAISGEEWMCGGGQGSIIGRRKRCRISLAPSRGCLTFR